MIPIRIDGQPIEIANSWQDISINNFSDIEDARKEGALNSMRLLSIFAGIDHSKLINFAEDKVDQNILPHLNFLRQDIDLKSLMLPKTMKFGGKIMLIPEDLRQETWGQKIMLQDRINQSISSGEPMYKLLPFAIATYFQPQYTGTVYDDKKAKELEIIAGHCKIVEAYPVAAFFLKKYIK